MCGLAGIVQFRASTESPANKVSAVIAMSDAARHRGPDAEGYMHAYFDGPAARFAERRDMPSGTSPDVLFGHRRLAIIDLSVDGNQPMHSSDRRYWIIHNGEIYNFREIAEEIRSAGGTLRSKSDTEVIVEGYRLWGEAILQRLNGMFAFAIWDDVEKKLFCARDRLGIKPFYYTSVADCFVFASDIKTIIASGLYTPEPDPEGYYHCLGLGAAPRPQTAFKGIKALSTGSTMLLSRDGTIKRDCYWRLPAGTQEPSMTHSAAQDTISGALKDSVANCMVADVPVALALSGGIDSGIIAALMKQRNDDAKAYTLGFEGEGLDETHEASRTAGHLGLDHKVLRVEADAAIEVIDDMIACYEEPFPALSPNYLIFEFISRDGINVVLSGLGGDELFGGYGYYSKLGERRRGVLGRMRQLLKCLPVAGDGGTTNKREITEYYEKMFAPTSLNDAGRHELLKMKDIRAFDSAKTLSELYLCDISPSDDFETLSCLDLSHYMANHHLYRSDQFAMRHSVEARFPFLDHNFVEAAATVPTRYKISGMNGKLILHDIARDLLPPDVLGMPKKGFRMPLDTWMRGPLRGLVEQKLEALCQRPWFNPDQVRMRYRLFCEKNLEYRAVWALVATELWMEKFFQR